MKAKSLILLVLFCFLSLSVFSQEKSKKELRAEKELHEQKETEGLINSKNFVFNAEKANPLGYRMIILDYNTYTIKVTEENVVCDLPYFGRAYNVAYGSSDGGMKFEGKPENITIEKKKKSYSIKMIVKGKDDVYTLLFSVFFDGGTNVSVTSNNKASISYDGEIKAPKAKI
ncbi:DUF4251 domain-containing protein [Flavobacterium sp. CLA17]|uniref:DUF4251 domain-containing protein n=1 Tax=Flavobacterium sp. CLA17 TaxID=2724135 RepID=UPI0014908DB8|nr:DUF4251 domain-containing protein [Flavobacterium sp. CLA17]QSB28497.1 DUF4251 domain-containing protein [Flavobacterium sp. CLA17]